jgi:lipopolysaccharide export system permease protein
MSAGVIVRGGNFGFSAAISLMFYVFYWGCLIGGEKLADRGFMSPFLSMWMGNFIVGVAGILLVAKVNNESSPLPG